MMRQEFDIGDLVRLVTPYASPTSSPGDIGMVTKSKRIVDFPVADLNYPWHRDEYHCLIKLTSGELEWVRAKFLKIISRASKKD